MKYLLIRHAKTDANHVSRLTYAKNGALINSVGKEQVKALCSDPQKFIPNYCEIREVDF